MYLDTCTRWARAGRCDSLVEMQKEAQRCVFMRGANQRRLRGHGVGVQCPSLFLSLSDGYRSLVSTNVLLVSHSHVPSSTSPLVTKRRTQAQTPLRRRGCWLALSSSFRDAISSRKRGRGTRQLSVRWSILIWDGGTERGLTYCRARPIISPPAPPFLPPPWVN